MIAERLRSCTAGIRKALYTLRAVCTWVYRFHADAIGCHIITVTNDILKKLELIDKDLHEYSLDTVKMFREDAVKANYTL
jgi:hypothetical protein